MKSIFLMCSFLLLSTSAFSKQKEYGTQYKNLAGETLCCTTVGPGLAASGCTREWSQHSGFAGNGCVKGFGISIDYPDSSPGPVRKNINRTQLRN